MGLPFPAGLTGLGDRDEGGTALGGEKKGKKKKCL